MVHGLRQRRDDGGSGGMVAFGSGWMTVRAMVE